MRFPSLKEGRTPQNIPESVSTCPLIPEVLLILRFCDGRCRRNNTSWITSLPLLKAEKVYTHTLLQATGRPDMQNTAVRQNAPQMHNYMERILYCRSPRSGRRPRREVGTVFPLDRGRTSPGITLLSGTCQCGAREPCPQSHPLPVSTGQIKT